MKCFKSKSNSKNAIALLSIGLLVFVFGCQKKVTSEPEVDNEQMIEKLKGILVQANSPFQDGIKFSSTGQIANSSNQLSGKWDFSKSVKRYSENYKSLSIPLKFTSEKHFILESSISDEAENQVTFPFLLYVTPTTGKTPFAVIVLKTTSLPLSKVERRGISPERLLVREVFYDLKGKLLYDTDNKEGSRTFYQLSELPNRSDISLNALQCSTTETKEFQCSVTSGYNATCTYITRRLMRCSQIPNNGDPLDPYNFLDFLEESDNMGGSTGEVVMEEVEFQNQNIIDSLTGFDCAQGVLASVGKLEDEVSKKIYDAFQINPNIKLHFSPDNSMRGSALNGEFKGTTSDGSGLTVFTITVNPDILESATKEFIYSVFMHESLHAWFQFERRRMGDSLFKATYPNVSGTTGSEARDHYYFSTQFVSALANSIKNYNPLYDSISARALAWRGLHETVAYKTLPTDSQNIYSTIWWRERNTSDTTTYGKFKGTKCQ